MATLYKTPEYYHCLDEVRYRQSLYEPEADTFLFLDALDKDQPLLQALAPRRCVEVGCGSGTVLTHLFALLHTHRNADGKLQVTNDGGDGMAPLPPSASPGPEFFAVDVNPIALEATGLTWANTLIKYFAALLPKGDAGSDGHAALSRYATLSDSAAAPSPPSPELVLSLVHGDLLQALDATTTSNTNTIAEGFDVVLFNPPYVPTSMEELQDAIDQKDVITAAWCGGPRGRVVLDRFIAMLPRYLSRRGYCYLVLIRENDEADVVAAVEAAFRTHAGLGGDCDSSSGGASEGDGKLTEMVPVLRRYTGEHLSIHRIAYAGSRH